MTAFIKTAAAHDDVQARRHKSARKSAPRASCAHFPANRHEKQPNSSDLCSATYPDVPFTRDVELVVATTAEEDASDRLRAAAAPCAVRLRSAKPFETSQTSSVDTVKRNEQHKAITFSRKAGRQTTLRRRSARRVVFASKTQPIECRYKQTTATHPSLNLRSTPFLDFS